MTTTMLQPVTIRLDAAYDLRAAGLPADEAAGLRRAYREAAAMICIDHADVTVLDADEHGIGCDAAWAEEFGMWQAAHDCCVREDGDWRVSLTAVERTRRNLAAWRVRSGM
jgi:hypothetical protein